MYKSKTRLVVVTFIIFVISVLLMNNSFAKNSINNSEITDWKVVITNDTKDLKDTKEISFKIQDNPNVVAGKIAPGVKAVADIEVDLTDTKVPVDIITTVDDSELFKGLQLTAKIDNENYELGTTKTIELENKSGFTQKNGKKIITLELKWENNSNDLDTIIGTLGGSIKLPITVEVKQHI